MNNGLKMRMLTGGSRNSGSNDLRNQGGRYERYPNDGYERNNDHEHRNNDRYRNEYRRDAYDQRGGVNERERTTDTRNGMYDSRGRMNDMHERSGRYEDMGMNRYDGRERRTEKQMDTSHDNDWDDDENYKHQTIQAGGTFWMEAPNDGQKLTREKAKEWVHRMRNADPAHPTGEKWSMDELKGLAQKKGIDPESEKFIEFYAMMNAMYSDYAEVAKQFGVSKPEFYAAMTMAWMNDKDAKDNKTEMYYKYIAKK